MDEWSDRYGDGLRPTTHTELETFLPLHPKHSIPSTPSQAKHQHGCPSGASQGEGGVLHTAEPFALSIFFDPASHHPPVACRPFSCPLSLDINKKKHKVFVQIDILLSGSLNANSEWNPSMTSPGGSGRGQFAEACRSA